jgi:hypothetical protein
MTVDQAYGGGIQRASIELLYHDAGQIGLEDQGQESEADCPSLSKTPFGKPWK